MDSSTLRGYLQKVEDRDWAKLGAFFSNYVSEEELERWLAYQSSIGSPVSDMISREQFSEMLIFFLEDVFQRAERYNRIPDVLREFIESSDDRMLELGVKLRNSLKSYERENKIAELYEQSHISRPFCDLCGLYFFYSELEKIITEK